MLVSAYRTVIVDAIIENTLPLYGAVTARCLANDSAHKLRATPQQGKTYSNDAGRSLCAQPTDHIPLIQIDFLRTCAPDSLMRLLDSLCHGDDHSSLGFVLDHVSESVAGLTQRIGAVDDWCDLPGFEEFSEDGHRVFSGRHRNPRTSQLLHEA